MFDAWLSQFCLEEKKGEISELLVGSPSIRALYTKMVRAQLAAPHPALVSGVGRWEGHIQSHSGVIWPKEPSETLEADQPGPKLRIHVGKADFWHSCEKWKGQQSLMGILFSFLGQAGSGRWV